MLDDMAKKQEKIPVQIRMPVALRDALLKVAERKYTDLSTEVIRAIREMLEREGFIAPTSPPIRPAERRTKK
jgi:hypothetical protein